MAGSSIVRLESTISAQALVVTSATSEIAATTPRNKKVGRACGACDGRSELGAGTEPNRSGDGAEPGATDGAGASTASAATSGRAAPVATDSAGAPAASEAPAATVSSLPEVPVRGVGGGESPFMIGVEFLR